MNPTEPKDIFDYVVQEMSRFSSEEVEVFDNYSWNFKRHVQMSMSFLHSQFLEGTNDYKVKNPFKNIVRPLMNLRFRAEDIDVKDIVLYVEEKNTQHLSFLVKKYYQEVFIKEHDLDTFLNEMAEEEITFGGVLVQKTDTACPEMLPLQSVAFCDQTDIFGGAIAFQHWFSPTKLKEMEKKGWGNTANGATGSIDDLIHAAQTQKDSFGTSTGTKKNHTPGKAIEVFIIRGPLPKAYLDDSDTFDEFTNQIQIVAFYGREGDFTQKTILYRKEEADSNLKFYTNKKVYLRALGVGGVEELFDDQIWTNFFEIQKKNMLEAGAKVGLYTDDDAFSNRNKIKDMENLEILTVADGKRIEQIPTVSPARIQLFDKAIIDLFEHAQLTESATDAVLGETPPAGTPFRLQDKVIQQGKGLSEYRREKKAKFIEELHQDWIIPYIQKEITKGKEFLSTLSTDELKYVSDCLVRNQIAKQNNELVLSGKDPLTPDEKQQLEMQVRKDFATKGTKHWVEVLKSEFKDRSLAISINVAGKQKDLAAMTDKLFSVLQFVIANPQMTQIPGVSEAVNQILELSGISPVDFAAMLTMPQMQPQSPQLPAGGAPPQGQPQGVPMPQMGQQKPVAANNY